MRNVKLTSGSAAGIICAAILASPDGATHREICERLGWKRARGTISRVLRVLPFKVSKLKSPEGLRYKVVA